MEEVLLLFRCTTLAKPNEQGYDKKRREEGGEMTDRVRSCWCRNTSRCHEDSAELLKWRLMAMMLMGLRDSFLGDW